MHFPEKLRQLGALYVIVADISRHDTLRSVLFDLTALEFIRDVLL
jgi:hypothetical protein